MNVLAEFRAGNRCNTEGYADSLQVLPGPGKMLGLTAHNKSTTVTYFLHIFDQVAEPQSGAPHFTPIPLEPTGDGGAYLESQLPREFTYGCWIMVSEAQATLTLSEDSNVWITAFKG
jgi:hypothetical protein